jgi:formylglycine-generating enzyme required for sulfatase activity
VTVGNPCNAPDDRYSLPPGSGTGPGEVDYTFDIGKYEVTAGQYCEFLNAVAVTDTYGLYNTNMDTAINQYGCNIKRSGNLGEYIYSVASDYANRPVNFVSWSNAARFTNWLNNGQPTGIQNAATTEDGAYTLNGGTPLRNAGAKWWIPSKDEWHKAVYYDPNKTGGGGYWDYPTKTDLPPGNDMSEQTNPGNNANYNNGTYPIDSGVYYTTIVGEFELSHSPYGTFDQGGNVSEWIETAINSRHCILGGSFGEASSLHSLSAQDYLTVPYYEWEGDWATGFRVATVPEPDDITLFVWGAIACLIWWRCRK